MDTAAKKHPAGSRRFSLRALLIAVFASGLGYGVSYGTLGNALLEAVLFWGIVTLGLLLLLDKRRSLGSPRPWHGSLGLILWLGALGLVAGMAHFVIECEAGPRGGRARFERVAAAVERFRKDERRYPASLRELAPRYLSAEDLEPATHFLSYRNGPVVSLHMEIWKPFFHWSYRRTLTPPTLRPPSAPKAASKASSAATKKLSRI